MMRHEYDIPVIKSTLSIRSPRAVALLHPFQLPLVLGLAIMAVVFTIWPETLSHTAVSFETRGVVHHIWHYTLLSGSLLAVIGMFAVHRRRLQIELSALFLLVGTLTMNLVALMADSAARTNDEPLSGLGVTLRAAVIFGLLTRAYIVVREPTVEIPNIRPDEGQ